jgi:hypothetical protein
VRFRIVVKVGILTITEIKGLTSVSKESFTRADAETLIKTEAFLEKLTGMRFHIEQEP